MKSYGFAKAQNNIPIIYICILSYYEYTYRFVEKDDFPGQGSPDRSSGVQEYQDPCFVVHVHGIPCVCGVGFYVFAKNPAD